MRRRVRQANVAQEAANVGKSLAALGKLIGMKVRDLMAIRAVLVVAIRPSTLPGCDRRGRRFAIKPCPSFRDLCDMRPQLVE